MLKFMKKYSLTKCMNEQSISTKLRSSQKTSQSLSDSPRSSFTIGDSACKKDGKNSKTLPNDSNNFDVRQSASSKEQSFQQSHQPTSVSSRSLKIGGSLPMGGERRNRRMRRQSIPMDHRYIQDIPRTTSNEQLEMMMTIGNINMTDSLIADSVYSMREMVNKERFRDWIHSFHRLDPRYQINKFFTDVAREGVYRIEETDFTIEEVDKGIGFLKPFSRVSSFSVWRPTSNDAIRKMMNGEAAGKGLDVKGKSAKKGKLSGFIPFVQIHEEKHKSKVQWPPRDGLTRIYYNSEEARNKAAQVLTSLSDEMVVTVSKAKEITAQSCSDEVQLALALKNLMFDVADPKIVLLDDYAPSLRFGIAVAERVFFNAYISKRDISRCSDYSTGRPSEPAFQDMNSLCIRKYKGSGPRAVIYQTSKTVEDALSPKSLVVAYEENGEVKPVASDFDCFLVGTRRVNYETPLSKDQVNLVKWLLTQIEVILDSPITSSSWTSRWLEVLKENAAKGFYPEMPEFGYGDPTSYHLMRQVVSRVKAIGAVRHGAECFNYLFPQELDDNFLVISDHLDGKVPWKYVNVQELQDILCERITEGFIFPLNPKWILADRGWKAVYDKMMSSDDEGIQKSLNMWYPPESGIRELIEDIHKRFPGGFQRSNLEGGNEELKSEGTEAMDLADQQYRRHITLERAKFKLRITLKLMKMGNMI